MADFDLIAQDPERIAETATANLQLTAQENPEAVALGFSKSREMGIPFTWAREMDNVDLHPAYSAEGLHSKFQEHIARNIDKAPLYRNNLVNLNNLAKAISESQADLQQRAEIARKRYEEEGLSLPTRLTLQDLGFVQKPDGKFEKDGKAVETPVILGDLVGPEEAAYIDELTGAAKTALDQDMTDWRTYHDLSPEGKKESLLRMVKHMEKVQAVINSLNQSYPEGWIDRTEKEIRELVAMTGERNGVDVSDVDARALKKGGALDADYGEAINVFGLRTLSKRITAPDAGVLANVGPESAPSDIEARYYQLREQNKELLGLNLAGKIAYGVTATVPYLLELGATAGIATVGKVPLQVALKTILKEGGFTGIKAGAKAIFTKKGLSALGKAGGAVLTAEAKRLPFVGTSIGAEALAEIEPEPVTFFGPDGVSTVVPDRTVGDIFNALVNKTVSRYVANASENTGILVSGFDFTKYVPETMFQKGFQNKVVSRFLSDVVANDPARAALLRSGFASANPFGGLGEEVFEEFVNRAADRILTLASEITGAEALDMGAETFFMGPEETFVTAVTALVQSTGGKVMRIPAAAQHTRNLLRFVDSHRKSVEMIQKAIKDLPGGAPEMKEFVSAMRGGDTELAIDPEDAETLYQKNPDIAKKLGLTEAKIADAVQKGELVTVSHNDLAIEQATNPEARELTEELLTKVQSGALKVEEALDKKTAAELVESYKAETDRVKTLREKIYSSALEAAREAKIPQEAQKSFATIAGLVTNYLDRHSLEEGRVEEALNRLAIQYKEDPGSFSAPDGLEQPVYHGTPHLWAPEPGFPYGRPRLDKIGTGEGGQAYGWGWYSAEQEQVARYYLPGENHNDSAIHRASWDILAGEDLKEVLGDRFEVPLDYVKAIVSAYTYGGVTREELYDWILNNGGILDAPRKPRGTPSKSAEYEDAKRVLDATFAAADRYLMKNPIPNGRALYKLDIPDEKVPYLILWDEALSEQPKEIAGPVREIVEFLYGGGVPLTDEAKAWMQDKFPGAFERAMNGSGGDARTLAARYKAETGKSVSFPLGPILDNMTGEDLYRGAGVALFSDKEASSLFLSKGILGVRYLDEDSRTRLRGKEPTYNYVIWDQDTLDRVALLERNGNKLSALQDVQNTLYQRVYHGTPHVWAPEPGFPFGRFRLDKLYTGEGRTGSGEGSYLTEVKEVAEWYRDWLSSERPDRPFSHKVTAILSDYLRNREASEYAINEGALYAMGRGIAEGVKKGLGGSGIVEAVYAEIGKSSYGDKPSSIGVYGPGGEVTPLAGQELKDAIGEVYQAVKGRVERAASMPTPSVYELEIPDKHLPYIMDVEVPLTEQPEAIRGKLENMLGGRGGASGPLTEEAQKWIRENYRSDVDWLNKNIGGDFEHRIMGAEFMRATGKETPLPEVGVDKVTPRDLYLFFSRSFGPKKATELFRQQGVVGLKYKSPEAKNPDDAQKYNFVVWDQKVLDEVAVLKRNEEVLQTYQEALKSLAAVDNQSGGRYIYSKERDYDKVRTNEKTGQADSSGSRGGTRSEDGSRRASYGLRVGDSGTDRNDGTGSGRRENEGGRLYGRGHSSVQRVLRDALTPLRYYYNIVRRDEPADDLELQELPPEKHGDFCKGLYNFRDKNPYSCCVSNKTPEELVGARVFQSPDGLSGMAVMPDGDMVAAYSTGKRNALFDMMTTAILAGGEKLDCYTHYDIGLWRLYHSWGFIPVCKVKFDEQYRPDDWNDAKFPPDNRPDIVFWIYNGDPVEETVRKRAEGSYATYSKKFYEDLKEFSGDDAYGEAMAYRDAILEQRKRDARNTLYQSAPSAEALDAEYMAALENEDEDALENLVEKAAKMAGYKIGPVYHWGSFDKSQDIPEGAMHFGTEEAAEERASGKIVDDELEGVEAYEGDDGAWHFDTGSETSEDLGYSGYDTEEDAIYEGREYLYSVLNTDSDIPEGEMTAAYLKIDNAKRVRDAGTGWDAEVEKAKAEGYDGIVYQNQFEDKGEDSYIIFSPEQVKSADPVTYDDDGNVIPLSKRFDLTVPDVRYQNRPGTYRGSFTPAQDFNLSFNAVINLFKHADASTLPHETFHWVRQMMKAMVDGGWADTALQQDHETIERWLDRQNYRAEPGTPEYLREREEKGASAFEEYLRSGRAPNSFVEKAFNTMKKLLTSIYSYVRGALLDVKLDDEITSLFDRMLSTEALVERDAPLKEAVDALKGNFTALLGISQEEAKGFQTIIREAMAQMESSIDGRKVRLLKTLRKTWREEAKTLIAESKTYQTWDRVKALGGLDTDFVKKTAGYGKDTAAFLRKRGLMAKTTETGIDVPLFAKEAGYASVDALMTDLVDAQTPEEFIGSYIRAKEAEFNANVQLEGDDLSTQASIDLLEKVTEALEQKSGIGGYRAKFRAFEAEVRKSLNGKQVSELVGDRNLVSAMRNTQKKLVAAISKKDYESALKLLLGLRWNIQSMKERASARKEIAKVENLYRRLRRVKPGIILGDYHEALKELAYFFGFSTREPKNLKENYREVLGKRIDEETGMETGPFSWPDFLKRENIESYKKLTYGEFQDLRDFTAFLEGTGRDLVSARKGTFANRVQGMLGRSLEVLGEQPKKYHNRKNERNTVASYLRYGLNWGLNLRTFLGAADRFSHMEKGAESGPNMALRDAALDGARRQIELETSAKRSISPAIDALKETADGMDVKKGLPEFRRNQLHGYTEWTPEMVISACLNMGTESNRQRLKAGFGWEDSDLDMIAGKLSSSDWRAIQTIWNALSSELWGAVSQTFFEENHFRLERIPAMPLVVSSSDGRVVPLEGGYYPIVYAHHARAKEMPMGFDPRALYSDVSSTHRRAQEIEDPDPLKLSLGVLENHIHSAAAYAAMRMPMRLVLRVVMSPEYADAFIQTQSPETYESVLAIFKNMANPNPSTERIMNGVEGWARSVLTATALMGNIKTAFAQFTSVTVGMQELGHYYVDALLEAMASPVETFARAREFSAMIRHRAEYQDIDLRKSVNAISDGPFDKARRKFVYFGYLAMRGADQIVATVGWHGKYLQALDQLAEKGDPDAYTKAVSLADDFVARTQGAARTLDLTPIQLNSLGRMVSPFITATMAQYNTTLETLGAAKEGRLSPLETLGALTGNLFAPVLFQAILSYIIFGGLLGDDDDDIDRARKMALKEILSSPFAGIPIVRDVASTSAEVIASRMTGAKRNAYGFNLLDAGAVNAVGDLGMDLIQGTEAAYDGNARRAIYLYLKSAGAAAGMPVLHMYEKAIRIWKNNGGEIPGALDTPSRSKKK